MVLLRDGSIGGWMAPAEGVVQCSFNRSWWPHPRVMGMALFLPELVAGKSSLMACIR